jgi:hypothetical protein
MRWAAFPADTQPTRARAVADRVWQRLTAVDRVGETVILLERLRQSVGLVIIESGLDFIAGER